MADKKKTTIEDLAKVVRGGFVKVDRQFDEMGRMAQRGFEAMDKRFNQVDERFNKIEKLILADHKERIERLEIQMKEIRDLLAVK